MSISAVNPPPLHPLVTQPNPAIPRAAEKPSADRPGAAGQDFAAQLRALLLGARPTRF